MTAPTYRRHGTGHVCRMTDQQCPDPRSVPAVVLTASDEDVERLARASAKAAGCDPVTWTAWREAARRMLADLLAPPIPPEPTDLFSLVEDSKGAQWYRSAEQNSVWRPVFRGAENKRYVGTHGDPKSWADLWAERGPLREVK